MSISGLIQFVLGFVLGVFLLTSAGAAAAYFFFNRMSDVPSQPVFSESEEESSEPTAKDQSAASGSDQTATETTQTSQSEPKPEPEPESEPEPEPEEPKTLADRFGEQAYEARVTWPSGLSLRANPSLDASRVGGVYYQDKLVIIETQGDWQRVYVPESGQQAWVKAGNVEKIN
ncbi:MAG: SH3 domain-containing protein [Cyanobacteria bacterium]|jgi:hypothetical protein|nr:SH3 domain-containing protein [Cyanobacteria bacterium GSL.Bin1]